ncbi:hypothetical protein ACOI1H_25915, partial [Loktanella sp. DJP18]|uniref:hypothetical protein n=1 Tax=Loktanella sp. DJP18 TaxID=3409788 RepID=UPI003BB4A493
MRTEGNEMDRVFRILTIVMTVGFATVVSSAVARMIFDALGGAGFVRLPLAAAPILIGIYASIHVIVSCLIDDRDHFPPPLEAD